MDEGYTAATDEELREMEQLEDFEEFNTGQLSDACVQGEVERMGYLEGSCFRHSSDGNLGSFSRRKRGASQDAEGEGVLESRQIC